MIEHSEITRDAIAIWKAGIEAADACKLVQARIQIVDSALIISGHKFPVTSIGRIIVVGFGKASGAMAVGLERALEQALKHSRSIESPETVLAKIVGQINVPDDQVVPSNRIHIQGCRPPGENLPTQRVVSATRRIVDLVTSADSNDLVLCLISGGGSALLEAPVEPITLDELRQTTAFLSRTGADIHELNAVRRNISQVKGGRLATASGGAPVISLIVSDVVGDPLDVIASGPTVVPADSIQAIDVLRNFDSTGNEIPKNIWNAVGSFHPKIELRQQVENIVIGSIETAMNAAAKKAQELGYNVVETSASCNEGDAEDVGRQAATQITELLTKDTNQCSIRGGETTVNVGANAGDGGRNQHLVLAAIAELLKTESQSTDQFCILSGGSDGEDGTQPVAGAFIDAKKLVQFRSQPSLPSAVESALQRYDSYPFHLANGTLFECGRTNTNVCDLRIALTR